MHIVTDLRLVGVLRKNKDKFTPFNRPSLPAHYAEAEPCSDWSVPAVRWGGGKNLEGSPVQAPVQASSLS